MVRARAGWAFPVRCAAPDFERHAAKTPGAGKCGLPKRHCRPKLVAAHLTGKTHPARALAFQGVRGKE